MKWIVNFSGGLCSFWAAMREIERHGRENVVLLFADVLIEDADLYRFNQNCSAIMGIPITRVSLEMTPWQLFRKEGLIGNNRFPICSVRLKRELLNAWMTTHFELERDQPNCLYEDATVTLGFDWTEAHRVDEFQNEHPVWRLSAPMTEPPLWDKCQMQKETERLGIRVPRIYSYGLPHNNCGGLCVRMGITHAVHVLNVLPEVFANWEGEEQQSITVLGDRGIEAMTILKDRRGGQTRPLSLRDLRLRVEAGEKFPDHDWGGCGCGGATKPASDAGN